MKYLAWLGGILVSLLALIYLMAFTSFGNNLLKPVLEGKIKEQTSLESELKTFRLTHSSFEILLELNKNNTAYVEGTYSLLTQSFDVKYSVNLEELQTLEPLTKTPLNDSFHTDGTVIGDLAYLKVDGKSDIATSETTYHVELTDFNPTSIIAKIDNADLSSLLYMLNQKEYASAKINLDMNFKNITPNELDGNILLVTKDGKLNPKVMRNDFNITIPATDFDMNLKAQLAGADVDYTYMLNSNLAKFSSSGKVTPEPLKIDIKYGVDVKELAVLKPITNADVRGALRLSGTVKGNKAEMLVDGRSDFASSDTTFSTILKDFAPASVKASIKNMKLQDVLYMVKQPHYADALFSLEANILDAKMGSLKGLVTTNITQGLVDSKYVTKAYEFKSMMPRTTFSAQTKTQLSGDIADTKLNFVSNLANFDIKQARFNIADTSLATDYLVKVHDLNALYFVTDRKLKGAISANGELKKAKDLDFTLLSNVAGGKLNAKLHNDDFVAKIDSMQTLELLDMLVYPEIFKSSINGTVNYNLLAQKGEFKGNLADGKFTKNQVLDLAKQYASTDLYQEIFLGDVSANINKENIVASLDLKSNRSYIKTQNTKLNSKTKQIDSKLDISANGNPLIITLSGDANAPKVAIDASKLIQKEAEKAITKEVNKLFKGLF